MTPAARTRTSSSFWPGSGSGPELLAWALGRDLLLLVYAAGASDRWRIPIALAAAALAAPSTASALDEQGYWAFADRLQDLEDELLLATLGLLA